MYDVIITKSAKRVIKKLPFELRKEIYYQIKKLKENPDLAIRLVRPLHFVYSLHFSFRGVQYRVAYTINSGEQEITVHLAGPRENFYKRLGRLF